MATPNFRTMPYSMPLICGPTYRQYENRYMEEYGEELTDDELGWMQQDDLDDACYLAKEFSENLVFYRVTVVGGYYDSFQFFVEENPGAEDIEEISNEDAHYYFDTCRSRAIRAAERERRKIYTWLLSLKKCGFNEVVCTALFSNGEAWYSVKN